MALDVGGLVYVRVVLAHVAPVDPAQGYDLAGAEDLALSGHARTTTRNLAAPSVRSLSEAVGRPGTGREQQPARACAKAWAARREGSFYPGRPACA
jgi:hypothetical protein